MKYFLFFFDYYGSGGGMDGYEGAFDSLDEAKRFLIDNHSPPGPDEGAQIATIDDTGLVLLLETVSEGKFTPYHWKEWETPKR